MLKTYHPHLACMMQECMEEQGDYVLRDEAFEMIDELKEQLKQQKAYEGQWQSTIDGLTATLKEEREVSKALRRDKNDLREIFYRDCAGIATAEEFGANLDDDKADRWHDAACRNIHDAIMSKIYD